MRIPIRPAGALGIIKDLSPYELPPEAWSDGKNVRMRDGAAVSIMGYASVLGTPTAAPYWLLPAFTATTDFWVYGAVGALYAVSGTTHGTLATGLGGNRDNRWNGGMFNGIGILNNGVADPQEWDPPGLATTTVDLTNWPASTTAVVVRPFGPFLIAYDVTKGGTRYPQMVKWSASADIGAVPGSWDETDPANDAGEWSLTETRGRIIDAKALGPVNFVYKQDEAHAMSYIGGQSIFDFKRRFGFGILAQDCVVEFQKRHFVATQSDLIVHDGVEAQSVLKTKMRRWYTGRPNPATSNRSYMVQCGKELWLCFPEAGAEEPNLALVYHLEDGTTTIRELPDLAFIAAAPIDPTAGSTTFEDFPIPFDSMVGTFGQQNFAGGDDRCVGARPGTTTFELLDEGFDNDGAGNFTSYVERTGLTVAGQDRRGNLIVDESITKLVTRVWPRVKLVNGSTLRVYCGSQESAEGPVTWQGPYTYDPSVAEYVDGFDVVGPYIAVRFESIDGTMFQLDEYALDITAIGKTA